MHMHHAQCMMHTHTHSPHTQHTHTHTHSMHMRMMHIAYSAGIIDDLSCAVHCTQSNPQKECFARVLPGVPQLYGCRATPGGAVAGAQTQRVSLRSCITC